MLRVSDINTYLKCPRICYFTHKGDKLIKTITSEYLQSLMIKELALTYGSVAGIEDKISILNNELDRIEREICIIYRNELLGIDDATIKEAVYSVRSCLREISLNLSSYTDFYSNGPVQVEPLLLSEKFGLTGSPHRLLMIDERMTPSIIKTGNIPENGVWQSDRLQLTAYSLLVEEKYDSAAERGFVEYARWGKVRQVTIRTNERRRVLQVIERIKKIQNGFMPEKPEKAPCESCGWIEICDVKSTLASRFF
ncbi:MAG: Dna2/Cas4 domain-containing protein [Candidatus Methanoperedens sp.]|nr:Dna2/Cas4 domain-containing protein [Candidatus Methanoperedens sp.]MCE8426231.1 Dna2/Cas4 domain-containing protein [Candidatus Methanoperedens sp.]MCE8428799.1 Dna2/Cas4 domain-containing protein [Candidatus Methanoperedens sp.]